MPISDNGRNAPLLVGVNDAVADEPIIPCVDVEVEPVPAAVAEVICVTVMPAAFVGGGILEGLGVEVGPPGRAVSVGTSVSVKVRVGVEVGVRVGVEVGVQVGVSVGMSV